jgi:hypothetical protein
MNYELRTGARYLVRASYSHTSKLEALFDADCKFQPGKCFQTGLRDSSGMWPGLRWGCDGVAVG